MTHSQGMSVHRYGLETSNLAGIRTQDNCCTEKCATYSTTVPLWGSHLKLRTASLQENMYFKEISFLSSAAEVGILCSKYIIMLSVNFANCVQNYISILYIYWKKYFIGYKVSWNRCPWRKTILKFLQFEWSRNSEKERER